MKFNNLAQKYIHHRNLLIRGQLELGVGMSLINTGLLAGIFLKNFFDISTHYIIYIVIGCILLTAILQYSFGWFYEKKKLFEEENNWLTDRTPVFKELMKNGRRWIK